MEGTSRGGGVTRLLNFLAVAATAVALRQALCGLNQPRDVEPDARHSS